MKNLGIILKNEESTATLQKYSYTFQVCFSTWTDSLQLLEYFNQGKGWDF